ncbi:MAG TPA: hypothetical protein VNA89_02895 [Gemmatimonadaceae bacterium]|nr:hypothetical protein [Gemmatimonadaceae bacterium]
MTDWLVTSVAGAAAQLAAAAGDTVLVRQVAEEPSVFDRVSGIASGLVSITLLVLTVALVPAAWNFRKSYKKISDLLDRVYGDVNPLMRHASAIADNVDYITTALRTDVQRVNRTLTDANRRLEAALAETERRVQEFQAVLRVVQDEAEDTFVSTAAAIRGVRTGAAVLRDGVHEELAEEMADAARAADEGLPDVPDDEDGIDVNNGASTTQGGRPGPRIRRRARGRGPA